ncbi:hypothetical protein ACFWAY_43355, partial [Rhodococcus sp. NPDC059968]
ARDVARPRLTPVYQDWKNGDDVTEDEHELAVLDFAVKWAPFGGGDEHILPEFGVFPTEFYQRLRRLLRHPGVNESVRRRLDELCTLKLAPILHPDRLGLAHRKPHESANRWSSPTGSHLMPARDTGLDGTGL